MDKIGYGAYLKEARTKRGLSQRGLALKSKVQNSTIARIEKEAVRPDPTTVAKLSEALEIDAKEFLDKCGYIPVKMHLSEEMSGSVANKKPATTDGDGLTEKQAKLLEIMKKLDPEDQQEVMDYARYKESRQKR